MRRSFESEDAVLRSLYERELQQELRIIEARAASADERKDDFLTADSLRCELGKLERARSGSWAKLPSNPVR